MKDVLILVGMRRVGKTTLLRGLPASHYECYDMDELFESVHSVSIAHFVEHYGWALFRQCEYHLLRDLLLRKYSSSSSKRCWIVATGGGIVELEASRNLLKNFKEIF